MLYLKFGFDLYVHHLEEVRDKELPKEQHCIYSLDISWGMTTSFDVAMTTDTNLGIDLKKFGEFVLSIYENTDVRGDTSTESYETILAMRVWHTLRNFGIKVGEIFSMEEDNHPYPHTNFTVDIGDTSFEIFLLAYQLSK